MKIEFKKSFYGCDLIVEADNVRVCEDVEERIYLKDENGKTLPNPKRDVDSNAIEMVSSVLCDMVYYREKDFDSTNLIETLFEKIPEATRKSLLKKLNVKYTE